MRVKEYARSDRVSNIVHRYRFYCFVRMNNKICAIVSDYPFTLMNSGIIEVEEEVKMPLYKADMQFRMTGKWNDKVKNIKNVRYVLISDKEVCTLNNLVSVFRVIKR